MPYEWIAPATSRHAPRPVAELHAWPYRSLPRRGFVWFIIASVAIVMIPLSPMIGTVVLWAVLPFFVLTIWAVWAAIERSYRDGAILEELVIWEDRVSLHHHDPRRGSFDWEANPHWMRAELHRDQKIEDYLTLKGGPREVELGAFLTPKERKQLFEELNLRLGDLRLPRQ
ncbi:MAG: hypothetical protein CSA72_03395 [Rhodobacterales bacterium]|nr:MAG: hypothetical protein CSA72_03395 [Rhodobacterales bacterium]